MHVLGIAGAGADEAATALASRLAERGRLGVVRRGDASDPGSPAATEVTLGDDGWVASGAERSLADTLDDLARTHDYALLVGFPSARVPHLALDGAGAANTVHEAASADAVDADAVLDALDGTDPFETLSSLVARAKRSPDAEYAGAIATFTGRVRAREDADDVYTEALEFEKYEGVADERLANIREELEARDGVFEVLFHHRTGVVEYGDDIVFVVVLAGHRAEAFRTVEDGIDRLKAEVPLFKKEVTVEEDFWVHER